MPKGYWIAHIDVNDLKSYEDYIKANAKAFSHYGGRFLVRGGSYQAVEGKGRQRNIVIEFNSYQKALDCYNSPEYKSARDLRLPPAAEGDLIILEGYDEPQPL